MTAKRAPAYRTISDKIRRDIVERRLRPGDRLPVEHELAARFGVGRSTIREVLRDLSQQNLIETTRGATGGSFVVVPDPERVADSLNVTLSMFTSDEQLSVIHLLEVREVLEMALVEMACTRAAPDQLAAIVDAANNAGGDASSLVEDWEFHRLIAIAADNPLLALLDDPVRRVLQSQFEPVTASASGRRTAVEHHREIAAALESGDTQRSREAMRQHLDWLRPQFRRVDLVSGNSPA